MKMTVKIAAAAVLLAAAVGAFAAAKPRVEVAFSLKGPSRRSGRSPTASFPKNPFRR
jgi:hypothetical protein